MTESRRAYRRLVVFLFIIVALGSVCGIATCKCVLYKDKVERLRPMAEKTREHCLLMVTMLRDYARNLDVPALHKTTQQNIDGLIDSSEQVEMCLDERSDRLVDPLKCILHGDDDKCRRDFATRFLDAMPERYKSFAPLD